MAVAQCTQPILKIGRTQDPLMRPRQPAAALRAPAPLLFGGQRRRKIPRPVAPEQLFQARIGKRTAELGQLLRWSRPHEGHSLSIGWSEKPRVKSFVHIQTGRRWRLVRSHNSTAQLRMGTQYFEVCTTPIAVDAKALCARSIERRSGCNRRAAVEVYRLDRQSSEAMRFKIRPRSKQPADQLLGIESQEGRGIHRQVIYQNAIAVGGVLRERKHQSRVPTRGRISARGV